MDKIVIFGKCFVENRMGKIRVGWIIHIFALLHAVVALSCRLAGAEDELLLTILTMLMALLICLRKGFNIEFTAASIIVVNIIGYLLGNAGATLFSHIISSVFTIHALATALTTEILGWSIVAFSKILKRERTVSGTSAPKFLKWVALAMTAAFSLRVGILVLVSSDIYAPGDMMNATSKVMSSSFALIILLCINIIYIRYAGKWNKKLSLGIQIILLCCFMLVATLICTLLSSVGLSFEIIISSWKEFVQIFIVSLITQITVYCIVYMVNYAVTAGSRMQQEKEKKHVAQYRYQKLKRQVNPHFLFNSLNALDCLVWEQKTEQASTYIHKLASVYRYMIKSEDDELVNLQEELTFVEMYTDLLKVRFPDGFYVEIHVLEEDKARFVLPCSIQLLIENVIKHNIVSPERPLHIKVESDGSSVRVSNNIIPKITKVQSTGLGQKYIRQQYMDLSGKAIHIRQTDDEYSVTLPLL